jgi:hypothetical protein
MTTEGRTYVLLVLDKSGSMSIVQDEVVSGVNAWLDELRESAPDASCTIVLFDGSWTRVVEDLAVSEVAWLTPDRYRPAGVTALYDALGTTLADFEGRVGPDDRALVLVVTDGEENSSKEYKLEQLRATLKRLDDTGRWTFTYLSADPAGFSHAQSLGIHQGNTGSFETTGQGVYLGTQRMAVGTVAWAQGDGSTTTFYSDTDSGTGAAGGWRKAA